MSDQLTPRELLDQVHRDRQRAFRVFVAMIGAGALILFLAVLWAARGE